MQVSRSRRQLLRDLQRLGCGHARSACGGGGGEWVLRGAAAGEDAEERNGDCSEEYRR